MKVITAEAAASLIEDGWTVTTGGFGHCGAPESLLKAVESRFLKSGSPGNLTLLFASGPGDRESKGIGHLSHRGLVSRIVGGFWSLAPKIGKMAFDNEIEAHNWPQGVISHYFRAVAGGKPGVITDVGLGTFIDPSQEGGCLNKLTRDALIEHISIKGKTSLLYRSMPIQCALLRGTRADERGNISMEREANIQDVLAQAQAVKNSGGIVIVQVLGLTKVGTLPLASVRIPGFLVDYVVVADPQDHWQTYGEEFNPTYSGQWMGGIAQRAEQTEKTSAKRIIARRALLHLQEVTYKVQRTRPMVVNLGIGTPEYIAKEARKSRTFGAENFTLTVESGTAGGFPAGGMSFGATEHPDAILTQGEQFDHYDGGGIDMAFLGFGQIDSRGRVNVASLGDRLNGVGGFINISQAAKQVIFCGTFSAGGLRLDVDDCGQAQVATEGRTRKMINLVERVCYDPAGRTRCKNPLVITERGVFSLSSNGLILQEVAPGIDVERDILNQSDFVIQVSEGLRTMPSIVFENGDLAPSFTT